jgi:glutamate 5-kinase
MTGRIVVKFGSGILTVPGENAIDAVQVGRLCAEVAELVKSGQSVVVVSSGAVAAGLEPLGLAERPEALSARQACAAVGQSRLMSLYSTEYAKHGLAVGQILLTYSDLDSRQRRQNARNTLECLLERGNVVPIINENDTVAVEELNFGDNDRLSAEVAILVHAEKLILLTSVDGLLDAQQRTIPRVDEIDSVISYVRDEKGRLSVGGMRSKLGAVSVAVHAGITTAVASGRIPGQILRIAWGESAGTLFPANTVAHPDADA